jgi:hypothetical protein
MVPACGRRSDQTPVNAGEAGGGGLSPAAAGLTYPTITAVTPRGDYLMAAKFAAADSQFTSLSKNAWT